MNLPENMTLQATLESDRERINKQTMLTGFFAWSGRISLLLAVIGSPWMIGSVGYWAQFWIAIALLAGLAFWWFETATNRRQSQAFPYVFVPLALGIGLGLFQLVPLPDGLEDFFGGRQGEMYERYSVDARVLDKVREQPNSVTKRLSLTPQATWEQLQMLLIAAAGMLLGCRLFRSRRDMVVLLTSITLNGVALTFFGWIQRMTDDGTHLYWTIDLTLGGAPFGPFVCRNNAAGYLLMCLAAAIGLLGLVLEKRKTVGPHQMVSREIPPWRQLQLHGLYFLAELTAVKLSVILAIVLIGTGILSTLSRGGVVALFAGAILTFVFYGMARKPKHTGFILMPILVLVFALSSWIGFGDQLIKRFEKTNTVDVSQIDVRVTHWSDTWPAIHEMGWFGSGLGSYRDVHRLFRQDRETKIFEYAENQYFQALLEAGWPGLILLLAALGIVWSSVMLLLYRGSSASTISLGSAGVFLLVSVGIASFFDFGLYIPANMLLMSVMVGFLSYHAQALAGRLKKQTWLRFQTPNVVVQVVLLCVFAGVTAASLDLYGKAELKDAMKYKISSSDFETLDLEKTNAAIEEVSKLVRDNTSTSGLNYLGELFIHRARLQYFAQLIDVPGFKLLTPEERQKTMEETWPFTSLDLMHENLSVLKRDLSEYQAARFLENDFITQNLPSAMKYFHVSRQLSPVQPRVHLFLGAINALIGSNGSAIVDFERAIELSPANAEQRLFAAAFYLQSGRIGLAAPHLRRYLELAPGNFDILMKLITGQTARRLPRIDDQTIYKQVIPDDPRMLYQFAKNYLDPDSPYRRDVLEKADEILGEASLSKRDDVLLSGDIRLDKGDLEGGIAQLELAMISDPGDKNTRSRLVRLYLKQGKLDKAKEYAEYLFRINRKNETFQKLLNDANQAIELRNREEKASGK
jgi:O-antigen ligase/tetratricopeptide (TPR) repeat protein